MSDRQETATVVSEFHICAASPCGYCEYAPLEDDPCKDECLHCGEPEERK